MSKINFTKLHLINDDASMSAAIKSVHTRAGSVEIDIHRILYAITARFAQSGDVRPAVKHVNELLTNLPKGVRSNAIRSWVEVHVGLIYAEEGENKGNFVAGKRKAKDLNLDSAMNERWFEFKPEAPFKPMDFDKLLASLLTKAAKADTSKGHIVDKGLVEVLAKARAEYIAAKVADAQ